MAKWTLFALIGKSTEPDVPVKLQLALTHARDPMAMWLNDVFEKKTSLYREGRTVYTDTVTEDEYYEKLKKLVLMDENVARVVIIRGLEAENFLKAKEIAKPYVDLINRDHNLDIIEAYEAFDTITDPVNSSISSESKTSTMLKKFIEIFSSME